MAMFGSAPIDIRARDVAATLGTGDGTCVMGLGWDGEVIPIVSPGRPCV